MQNHIALAAHGLLFELGPNSRKNMETIVSRASELLKCDSTAYGCVETATGELRFRATHNLPPRPSALREMVRTICKEIIAGQEAETECEFIPSWRLGIPLADELARSGFKSFLGHPVAVSGKRIGAIVALHSHRRTFNEQDRALMALLARILAMEDARHQREEDLRRRISLEKMLKDLSAKAMAVEDTSAFIAQGLQMVGTRMGVGGASLWEYDPREKVLSTTCEWLAESHPARKSRLQNIPIGFMPWSVGRLLKGDILRIDDISSVPAKRERRLLEKLGVHAFLVIPLFSKDRFYGFIGLECYRGPKSWVAEDTQVLQTAAEIMMRCIENRELTKELTDIRINLEKRVRTKTHSLQEANRRLKDEITAHRDSIARLKQREAELADKNKTFMDLTNDLAGLIHHGKGDAGEAEECVLRKLDLLIDPAQARTAATRVAGTPAKYIDHVRGGLKELSSMLKTQSSFVYRCLTPMEIQVANLIKQGRGNKEVADLLNVSRRTVEVHRYNIRKKLQLDKKKMNLKTFLSNLE